MEFELKTLQTRGFIQSYDEDGKIHIGESERTFPGQPYRTFPGCETGSPPEYV